MKIIKVTNKNINISDIKIFFCAPGLGKTYLANTNNKFIDLDRKRSLFKYGFDESFNIEEHEKVKGTNRIVIKSKEEILNYSVNLIKDNIKINKISLAAPNQDIIDEMIKLEIPYVIVFMDINKNNLLKERLIKRGNTKEFIETMYNDEISKYYYNLHLNENKSAYKIIFDQDEYLSDINLNN